MYSLYLLLSPDKIDSSQAITAVESAIKALDSNPAVIPEIDKAAVDASHLVIVPGHAIWKGGPTQGQDPNEW